jgi:hypothetical protein
MNIHHLHLFCRSLVEKMEEKGAKKVCISFLVILLFLHIKVCFILLLLNSKNQSNGTDIISRLYITIVSSDND